MSRPVHLIVLIHGLYGNPRHLSVPAEEIRNAAAAAEDASSAADKSQPEVVTFCCTSFAGGHTWDGIDTNAWRALEEVKQEIGRIEEDEGKDVELISFMGYSLGGLIARHLIGQIQAREPSFFERHQPATFSTAATPHLGVVRYGSRMNTIMHTLGQRLFSRTGQQLYCSDRDERGRCLLEVMADPDEPYLQALQRFPRVLIVANGCYDLTVPFPTAAISANDPFADFETTKTNVEVDDQHIVQAWFPHDPTGSGTAKHGEDLGTDSVTAANGSVAQKYSDDEVSVTVSVQRRAVKRRRPRLPPVFLMSWPRTIFVTIFFPILIPLMMLLTIFTSLMHSFHSGKRIKLHEAAQRAVEDGLDEAAPLLTSAKGTPRRRRSSRRAASRKSTASSRSSGTSTPVLSFDREVPPLKVPVLISDRQRTMIENINAGVPQLERLIAWFPWVYNTHAMIVVRDAKTFPFMEEGRGVVKAWARWVLGQDGPAMPEP